MPRNTATKAFWFGRMQFFVTPHPTFPADEKIFIPRDHLTIGLFLEGGIHLVGDASKLQINFGDSTFLVVYYLNHHQLKLVGWAST